MKTLIAAVAMAAVLFAVIRFPVEDDNTKDVTTLIDASRNANLRLFR